MSFIHPRPLPSLVLVLLVLLLSATARATPIRNYQTAKDEKESKNRNRTTLIICLTIIPVAVLAWIIVCCRRQGRQRKLDDAELQRRGVAIRRAEEERAVREVAERMSAAVRRPENALVGEDTAPPPTYAEAVAK